jgi:transcriptional regulator with XRE-family HTH domain
MTDENILIAQRIRAARLQRNLTQQDMADKFSKTSAAISDIERGKTQITASDLLVFADLLIKPIEYFYGEDYGDPEIDDLIALMRRLPPEMRKQQLPMMSMMLRMSEIKNTMQNTEDKEKQLESVKEFYDMFLPYYNAMESMLLQLREAKEGIESLLK